MVEIDRSKHNFAFVELRIQSLLDFDTACSLISEMIFERLSLTEIQLTNDVAVMFGFDRVAVCLKGGMIYEAPLEGVDLYQFFGKLRQIVFMLYMPPSGSMW